MSGTRAAIRYAKAILSVAEDNKTSAKIQQEMNQIANAIASNPALNEVLKSPVVKLSCPRTWEERATFFPSC